MRPGGPGAVASGRPVALSPRSLSSEPPSPHVLAQQPPIPPGLSVTPASAHGTPTDPAADPPADQAWAIVSALHPTRVHASLLETGSASVSTP
eukprot:scaffold6136_cov96-Isochrysis_galbana.AAC.3